MALPEWYNRLVMAAYIAYFGVVLVAAILHEPWVIFAVGALHFVFGAIESMMWESTAEALRERYYQPRPWNYVAGLADFVLIPGAIAMAIVCIVDDDACSYAFPVSVLLAIGGNIACASERLRKFY